MLPLNPEVAKGTLKTMVFYQDKEDKTHGVMNNQVKLRAKFVMES